ncbi:MAG: polysaccharide deacetylase family protein [Pseudobdellovibrionaceae bacterium]|jgi:peptidoglycan/xylan/chitin deacetylase (PgdA/CDA1 family)|nr:polysaccharide deacetylase family protein [Pseudobdellovibrionaceae bacterium]
MPCKSIILFLCAFFVIGAKTSFANGIPDDVNSAVIYAYFQIGDPDGYDQTLTMDLFKRQIDEFSSDRYHVASLDEVLSAQAEKKVLPPRTVVLSFEQFDRNFVDMIWPILEEYNLPFTLVLNASRLDDAETNSTLPDWDEAKKFVDNPAVSIAMFPFHYRHLSGLDEEAIGYDVNRALARFREKIGHTPKYFSYPYGEFSQATQNVLNRYEFVAALTQNSGVVGMSTPRLTLPRFTLTDSFGEIDRLRVTSAALPFPVSNVAPFGVLSQDNPPVLTFIADKNISSADLKNTSCYASGLRNIDVSVLDHQVRVTANQRLEDYSKNRINCTIPVTAPEELGDADGLRWRWAGFLFIYSE